MSSKRRKIEESETKRFLHNLAVLLLMFLVATNFGLLVLRVDQLFEGELYVVKSAEVLARPGRKISEAKYAQEIGASMLPETSENRMAGTTRGVLLAVVASLWVLAILLIAFGYLGMLKSLATGAIDRAEYYRNLDLQRLTESD